MRDLSVANRQMVEIAKAVSYDSDILIMDEPTSALTDREVGSSLQDHSDAEGPGQGHRLHHPQDERAVRDRRRSVGVPRRPFRRRARRRRRYARRDHSADGRPRNHPDVSRRRRCRSARSRSRCENLTLEGRVSRHLLRSAQGRDSRLRRPRRLGAQQRRRNPVRRHAGDIRARSQSTARRSRSRTPASRWTPAWRS